MYPTKSLNKPSFTSQETVQTDNVDFLKVVMLISLVVILSVLVTMVDPVGRVLDTTLEELVNEEDGQVDELWASIPFSDSESIQEEKKKENVDDPANISFGSIISIMPDHSTHDDSITFSRVNSSTDSYHGADNLGIMQIQANVIDAETVQSGTWKGLKNAEIMPLGWATKPSLFTLSPILKAYYLDTEEYFDDEYLNIEYGPDLDIPFYPTILRTLTKPDIDGHLQTLFSGGARLNDEINTLNTLIGVVRTHEQAQYYGYTKRQLFKKLKEFPVLGRCKQTSVFARIVLLFRDSIHYASCGEVTIKQYVMVFSKLISLLSDMRITRHHAPLVCKSLCYVTKSLQRVDLLANFDAIFGPFISSASQSDTEKFISLSMIKLCVLSDPTSPKDLIAKLLPYLAHLHICATVEAKICSELIEPILILQSRRLSYPAELILETFPPQFQAAIISSGLKAS